MKWRVALVDDEAIQLELLQKMLRAYGKEHNIIFQFLTFDSSEAFLFHFEEDKAIDLLILDIEMGKMNGMELAKRLRAQNHEVKLLFVTGYTDYIAQGYEVSAIDYVLKPVKREKLFQVLDRFRKISPDTDKYLLVETAEGGVRFNQQNILFFEANKHQTIIATTERKIDVTESFNTFEENVSSDEFIKTHRSYLVNLTHIKKITRQDVILDNEEKIPVSRRKYREVNQAFIDYFKRR